MVTRQKLTHIPTNLIMGFLGVGKTTAILGLLQHKPEKENWAVLVNEFGKVGVDGEIFSSAGATVKEIAGGCLCCAANVPFQTSINRLIKEARPDRLIIEPSGLGHPKKVLDMLVTGSFKDVLDVYASICLVDPNKLKDNRYVTHENFVDQIALSDVLVANKVDLAESDAVDLFFQWAERSQPGKTVVAQTTQGQLNIDWLDIARIPDRPAVYPNAHRINKITSAEREQHLIHSADGYQSYGYLFSADTCFEYNKLSQLFKQLKEARIKGIISTDQGWFMVNGVDGEINFVSTCPSTNNRIEIIAREGHLQDISNGLDQCKSS